MPGRTKIKRQEVRRENDSGHPVIILLGETGAGKSTFISTAGPDLTTRPEVGHGLISCTTTVQEYQIGLPYAPGKFVRLVDTPGFNDSDCNGDGEKLSKIIEWLKNEPQTKIIGIIFLHGIDQDRLARDSTVVSPKDIPTPPGVFIVTTKWDASMNVDKQDKHECDLQAIFPSTPIMRFQNTFESAWKIIAEIQRYPSGDLKQETFREALEAISPQFKRRDVSIVGKMKMIFRRMFG